VFSSWKPLRLLIGAFIFGLALRSNYALQALGNTAVPAEVLSMLPYLLTIAALLMLARGDFRRRLGAPAALGLPYGREER
jgi:simple sugar transport system permease protein